MTVAGEKSLVTPRIIQMIGFLVFLFGVWYVIVTGDFAGTVPKMLIGLWPAVLGAGIWTVGTLVAYKGRRKDLIPGALTATGIACTIVAVQGLLLDAVRRDIHEAFGDYDQKPSAVPWILLAIGIVILFAGVLALHGRKRDNNL